MEAENGAGKALEAALGKNFALLQSSEKGERELLLESVECVLEAKPDAQTLRGMALFTQKKVAAELEAALGKDLEAREIADELERIETVLAQNLGADDKRKIVVAACKDFRAIIAMLGIQLAKTREMKGLAQAQRKAQAENAMHVFAPIAHKLGIYSIKALLEDCAFRELQPIEYAELERQIRERRPAMEREVSEVVTEIEKRLAEKGWKERAKVQARAKHVYSAWKKMQRKNIGAEQLYDLVAVRIIARNVSDCYELLGMIHSMWQPLPGEFDDYIAKPKPNGYQSLHTAVVGPAKKPVEIQIRTEEMHLSAELGIAAHWRYKGQKGEGKQEKRLGWLKEALEWGKGVDWEEARLDFFENQIYVFTPKGHVIELPEGSTPIDFAYAVHSEIGNRCEKARVNGKLVPLSARLENADTVEIITSQRQSPKRSWLSMAVTAKALGKIRQALEVSGLQKKREEAFRGKRGLAISGAERKVKLARCCSPLPGDEVVGIRTTKRKVSVHRADCPNAVGAEKEKLVKVNWGAGGRENYEAQVTVVARDLPGILSRILSALSGQGVKVSSSTARAVEGANRCVFSVRVKDLKQLERALKGIEGTKGVIWARRETSKERNNNAKNES